MGLNHGEPACRDEMGTCRDEATARCDDEGKGEVARYVLQLGGWYSQHRQVCSVRLGSWTVKTSVDQGSSCSKPRLWHGGTVSRSTALGAEPHASRVSNLRVSRNNVDPEIVLV